MTVFSSLQTLAEKYEKEQARQDFGRRDEYAVALAREYVKVGPLLEAAVKALEGASAALDATESALGACVERGDCSHLVLQTMVWKERDKARAALVSLTGEPR